MAGVDVNRNIIDIRLGEAAMSVRRAFDQVDNIYYFLQNNPSSETDPLCTEFGYTVDEAYLIRVTFEGLKTLRTNNEALATNLRKFTGVE